MQQTGVRLRTWLLMVCVAVVAVSVAVARIDSVRTAAFAIIGSSVFLLAHKNYSEAVVVRRANGWSTSRSKKAGLILASTTIAVGVIGLSDIAFLVGYYDYLHVADQRIRMSHYSPSSDPDHLLLGGAIGTILAFCVGSSLRRILWPDRRAVPGCLRRCLTLWPVLVTVLVALSLGLDEMQERSRFCTMMAKYHAESEARAESLEKAASHAWLKRWFEEAAVRPWLPIHRDHVPPGL
jgi:hypothetical protein